MKRIIAVLLLATAPVVAHAGSGVEHLMCYLISGVQISDHGQRAQTILYGHDLDPIFVNIDYNNLVLSGIGSLHYDAVPWLLAGDRIFMKYSAYHEIDEITFDRATGYLLLNRKFLDGHQVTDYKCRSRLWWGF
jgi:hypothetical protein